MVGESLATMGGDAGVGGLGGRGLDEVEENATGLKAGTWMHISVKGKRLVRWKLGSRENWRGCCGGE
jgi:hypothetical protein